MRYIEKNVHVLLSVFVMLITLQLSRIAIPSHPSALAVAPVTALNAPSIKSTANAARYSENEHSWTLSAKVLEVKDVLIYGRPGTIARIEYINNGEPKHAWAAVRMDEYFFSDRNFPIVAGSEILLQVSGSYVSSKGVDWTACPGTDLYCQNASFIEGGFPASEDFGGLSISPSNMLIHRGSVTAGDWINGLLAWKMRHNT